VGWVCWKGVVCKEENAAREFEGGAFRIRNLNRDGKSKGGKSKKKKKKNGRASALVLTKKK